LLSACNADTPPATKGAQGKVNAMAGTLKVERVGGLAGFGGPHLKSRGEIAVDSLAPADQARIDTLFTGGSKPAAAGTGDMFRYRLTRSTPKGEQTIEVPGAVVPAAVANSVKDVLE
jgi:hypothetical protein